MHPREIHAIAAALGSTVLATQALAGGFSHETCLLTLPDGKVVVRLGGPDPATEAAIMAAASPHVPVPTTLMVVSGEDLRPAMVLEHVAGTPLSEVLSQSAPSVRDLGAEVGRVVATISTVSFPHPGFFADAHLTVAPGPPWSRQLPELAETWMSATPEARLDKETRQAWVNLCATHAPSLAVVDTQARLVHADANPKNILVTKEPGGWRVTAVLDWEFSYSGCPYGDAANMSRFAADYPSDFLTGFRESFAAHQPADLPPVENWAYLGSVLDMFALSDLVTRPLGHPVADQAATQIRRWLTGGVPD